MKRHFWVIGVLLVGGLLGSSKILFAEVYIQPAQETGMDNRAGQASHEFERTKELLEIWKDHVRTLTRERDEAYKETEALKNQGASSAAAPAAETVMSDTPSDREAILKEL